MNRILRCSFYFFCLSMMLWGTAFASFAAGPVRFISNRIKIERPEKMNESRKVSTVRATAAEQTAGAPAVAGSNQPAGPEHIAGQKTEETTAAARRENSQASSSIKEEIERLIGKKRRLYSRKDRIDPFEPFLKKPEPTITPTENQKLQIRPPQTPLEMVDLSQLRLTAILRSPTKTLALVEESSGKGYVVSKNTYIGNKGGQISKILKDRIIVEEKYLDMFGNIAVREKELKIQN